MNSIVYSKKSRSKHNKFSPKRSKLVVMDISLSNSNNKPNLKYFIYSDQQYPFDIQIFNQFSSFFTILIILLIK